MGGKEFLSIFVFVLLVAGESWFVEWRSITCGVATCTGINTVCHGFPLTFAMEYQLHPRYALTEIGSCADLVGQISWVPLSFVLNFLFWSLFVFTSWQLSEVIRRRMKKEMATKLVFGSTLLLILFGAAFGYRWVGQSREEEPLIETPSSVRTSEFDTLPIEVQQAAERGLPQFLRGLSYDELGLESYGIKSAEEAQSATLGSAYLLYTVEDLTQLAKYSPGQRASALITPTQTWYFAVLINNEPRVDLTVAWHESRWQAVRIGGSLSREMDEIEGITAECSPKLVIIFPLHASFAFLDCADGEFIIPLAPTNLERGRLYPAEEIMLSFAEDAKEDLKAPPGLVGQ